MNPGTQTLSASLTRFFLRELESLRRELQAFSDDAQLWVLPDGLPNSAGTLTLHLVGNLQHYIGKHLGDTDYVRDRDNEFAARDVPRSPLLEEIATTERVISAVLPALPDEALNAPYPEPLRGRTISTGDMLLQLAVHLGYHLGQISYHRRLVTGNSQGVDALAPEALLSAHLPDPSM